MKKILAGVLVVGTVLLCSCGNKQILDTTYKYDTAILSLPDGSIVSGEVQSWSDYDDGDQIQVKINGTTYLVHSVNIVLIHK